MTVAARNANDGISLAQVAEGAMEEVTNIFQRMRELAVQSANGTNSTTERTALNAEYDQLSSEVDRIVSTTRFGNTDLLDGTLTTTLQVGDKAGETISLAISLVSNTDGNILSAGAASNAMGSLTTLIQAVDAKRGNLGAIQNRLESTIANSTSIIENASAARSRIRDADFADDGNATSTDHACALPADTPLPDLAGSLCRNSAHRGFAGCDLHTFSAVRVTDRPFNQSVSLLRGCNHRRRHDGRRRLCQGSGLDGRAHCAR